MPITTHYRNYQITEIVPGRVVVTLPHRVYPLVGLELTTVEQAKKWVDDNIQDEIDEYKQDMIDEMRYEGDDE